jgi:hypothetical protein
MLFWWICRNFDNVNFFVLLVKWLVFFFSVVVWSYHGLVGLLICLVFKKIGRLFNYFSCVWCLYWFILIWVSNFNMHSSRAKEKKKKRKNGAGPKAQSGSGSGLIFRGSFSPGLFSPARCGLPVLTALDASDLSTFAKSHCSYATFG